MRIRPIIIQKAKIPGYMRIRDGKEQFVKGHIRHVVMVDRLADPDLRKAKRDKKKTKAAILPDGSGFFVGTVGKGEHFDVDRADDCVWLTDKRGKKRVIHLTKEQAKEVGKNLVSISKARGGFRMARYTDTLGEEESKRAKKERSKTGDWTPHQERFRERARQRREDYGEQ